MPPSDASAEYQALLAARRQSLSHQIESICSDSHPFVCEFGSGHGHFLTAYAQRHRSEVCVGIDIIGERVERAKRKRDRARLDHLHFLHAEARLFLETLPAPSVISKVFILFPDPWPKKRHHKHRLIQPAFLSQLRSRVSPSAQLFFRTDYQPYFDEVQVTLSEHPEWRLSNAAWPFEHETVFQQRADTYRSLVAEPRA